MFTTTHENLLKAKLVGQTLAKSNESGAALATALLMLALLSARRNPGVAYRSRPPRCASRS